MHEEVLTAFWAYLHKEHRTPEERRRQRLLKKQGKKRLQQVSSAYVPIRFSP